MSTASDTATVVPSNIEAEQALLGSILIDPGCLQEVGDVLLPGAFYRESHNLIFDALRSLNGSGGDFVMLTNALEARGELQAIGGTAYLLALITATPTAAHAVEYARIVQDLATRRALLAELQRIAAGLYDASQPLENIQAQMQRAADTGFVQPGANQDNTLLWEQTFDTWAMWQLERAAERGKPRIDLPWSAFGPSGAVTVRPLRPGTLAVVSAPPGVGKTAFAECCAEHWCRHGFQAAFFHYELSEQLMLDRRMARWSGESMATIESGELTERMDLADETLKAWPGRIHYTYCEGWPVLRLAARARRMIRRKQAQVVIVDYLQKAPFREYVRGMTTAQMIGQDVEVLKALAEREQVPVLLLSQLSRAGELLGSGDISRKANLVINLERKKLDVDTTFGGRIVPAGRLSPLTIATVEKQTIGDTGEAKLMFNGPRFLIADIVVGGGDRK